MVKILIIKLEKFDVLWECILVRRAFDPGEYMPAASSKGKLTETGTKDAVR